MMWMFWFPFLLVVPAIMLWRHGTGAGCCGAHESHAQPTDADRIDPVEIVRQRLAHGEITREQYEEIRRTLG